MTTEEKIDRVIEVTKPLFDLLPKEYVLDTTADESILLHAPDRKRGSDYIFAEFWFDPEECTWIICNKGKKTSSFMPFEEAVDRMIAKCADLDLHPYKD